MIRARSIHSNRHGPSRDIAQSFSHMHAVRHLVSGGYITVESEGQQVVRQAGMEILRLVKDKIFLKLMGMATLVGQRKTGQSLSILICYIIQVLC